MKQYPKFQDLKVGDVIPVRADSSTIVWGTVLRAPESKTAQDVTVGLHHTSIGWPLKNRHDFNQYDFTRGWNVIESYYYTQIFKYGNNHKLVFKSDRNIVDGVDQCIMP